MRRSERSRKTALSCGCLLAVAALAGCRSTVEAVPDTVGREIDAYARAESLRSSVEAIAGGWGNLGRLRAVCERAAVLGLEPYLRTEWIDWFSLQRNVVIEIPGESDRLVYFVAHYDKTDVNPFKLVSLLLNGILDEPFSATFFTEGAIDNATGVAVCLELAASLSEAEPYHTYRVLLTGSEESGLRGSRAHVASLSREEKDAILLAINIDTVGVSFSPNCVTYDVSDPKLVGRVMHVAASRGLELKLGEIPPGASSDFVPFQATSFWRDFGRGLQFNLVGGLLPQRSWFTGSHEAPVLNLSACELVGIPDYLAALVLLPFGRVHGPRDRALQVDVRRLYEIFAIVRAFVETLRSDAGGGAELSEGIRTVGEATRGILCSFHERHRTPELESGEPDVTPCSV